MDQQQPRSSFHLLPPPTATTTTTTTSSLLPSDAFGEVDSTAPTPLPASVSFLVPIPTLAVSQELNAVAELEQLAEKYKANPSLLLDLKPHQNDIVALVTNLPLLKHKFTRRRHYKIEEGVTEIFVRDASAPEESPDSKATRTINFSGKQTISHNGKVVVRFSWLDRKKFGKEGELKHLNARKYSCVKQKSNGNTDSSSNNSNNNNASEASSSNVSNELALVVVKWDDRKRKREDDDDDVPQLRDKVEALEERCKQLEQRIIDLEKVISPCTSTANNNNNITITPPACYHHSSVDTNSNQIDTSTGYDIIMSATSPQNGESEHHTQDQLLLPLPTETTMAPMMTTTINGHGIITTDTMDELFPEP